MTGPISELVRRFFGDHGVFHRAAAASGIPPDSGEAGALVLEADRLRDAGRQPEAANYYEQALALAPDRADLAVQLGNMRKDSGDFSGAEAAYRQALERRPDDADAWLQLGRALKLAGRLVEAEHVLRRALNLDPEGSDAALELASLGADMAGEESSRGRWSHVISAVEAAAELTELRRRIDKALDRLPALASLTAAPAHRYDILRQSQDLPRAPLASGSPIAVLVDGDAATPDALFACLASLREQHDERWHLVVRGAVGLRAESVARAAETDPRIVGLARAASLPAEFDGFWTLHLAPGRFLHPEAVGWLIAARERLASLGRPIAIYGDEEYGAFEGASGQFRPQGVALGVGVDPLFEAARASGGASLFVPPAFRTVARDLGDTTQGLLDLRLRWAREGALAHLPAPVCRRLGGFEPPRIALSETSDAPTGQIDMVILSRDNPGDLVCFVDSLIRFAARPQDISVTIVDHASLRPETAAALKALAGRPNLQVIRSDACFNWARLNNQAAASGTGSLLLFANDDMRMSTPHWDEALRRAFTDPSVGVVGTRLLYPDGTIQHAGAIAGWHGTVANEGVGHAASEAGPSGRWMAPRECAAVVGAFLATRRDLFTEIGGLDEVDLPISLSDTDYCFKVRARGFKVIYRPDIELTHHEGKTRGRDHDDPEKAARQRAELAVMRTRWGAGLDIDPSVHPLFLDEFEPFRLIRFPRAERLLDHLSRSADPQRWRLEPRR